MAFRPTITVAQPCHENWAAMAPAAQGRHCAACNKVVVDFTCLTDAEMVAFLSRPTGAGCGRFRAEQLNRPLGSATPVSGWRRVAAAVLALAGLGAATPATAQQRLSAPVALQPARLSTAPVAATAVPERLTLPSRTIKGRVIDPTTDTGLPGVTVLLRGTSRGVATDRDGYFELAVPEVFTDNQIIDISSIGFEHHQTTVGRLLACNGLPEIKLSYMVLGGFGYTPVSFWQYVATLFQGQPKPPTV